MKTKVLLVGLHPDAVDYADPAYKAWPGLTPTVLMEALEKDRLQLEARGYDAQWGFWDNKPDALDRFIAGLTNFKPDVVGIGAGVRLNPKLTPLFETLVNTVREHAPQARICFNSGPSDTAAAVERVAGGRAGA